MQFKISQCNLNKFLVPLNLQILGCHCYHGETVTYQACKYIRVGIMFGDGTQI